MGRPSCVAKLGQGVNILCWSWGNAAGGSRVFKLFWWLSLDYGLFCGIGTLAFNVEFGLGNIAHLQLQTVGGYWLDFGWLWYINIIIVNFYYNKLYYQFPLDLRLLSDDKSSPHYSNSYFETFPKEEKDQQMHLHQQGPQFAHSLLILWLRHSNTFAERCFQFLIIQLHLPIIDQTRGKGRLYFSRGTITHGKSQVSCTCGSSKHVCYWSYLFFKSRSIEDFLFCLALIVFFATSTAVWVSPFAAFFFLYTMY